MASIKVGIVNVFEGRKSPNQRIYEEILSYNNVPFENIQAYDESLVNSIRNFTHIIYRWPNNDNHHQLSSILRPTLDSLGIMFLPNSTTSFHYDDKVKQFFYIQAHGNDVGAISVPTNIFFSKSEALKFVESVNYPIVAKFSKGAGSSNVWLIKSKRKAIKHIKHSFSIKGIQPYGKESFLKTLKINNSNWKKTFTYYLKKYVKKGLNVDLAYWQIHKNYVLFQDFLSGNKYDTRVTTVGNRVHAFRRFTRENDFRASGGSTWDINPEKIDKRMLRIALDFSKKMNFSTMAYDFIYDDKQEPRIVEMSYMFGQPGFPDFMNGYWDDDLIWIEGRFWPQFFELVDFLGMPQLVCPKIEIPHEWIKNEMV